MTAVKLLVVFLKNKKYGVKCIISFFSIMEVQVKRLWKKAGYTVGRLYIDGKLICNTMEDKDRGLAQNTPIAEILKKKVPSETAIPKGRYKITLDVTSPKFSKYAFYKEVCNGKVPRLLDVPGFDGILIHAGATARNSSGCILVGYNTITGTLTDYKSAFKAVYSKLKEARDRNEEIWITIS